MTTLLKSDLDIYPETDGKPMSENTEHYRWIVTIKENLEILYTADADVFVAGDLFWYPREQKPGEENPPSVGPDVMVIFGVPKGKRGTYQQWMEGNIVPQVVFEIRSPSNTSKEMIKKFDFYQQYGVKEYYLYDFTRFALDGWQRRGERLEPILNMNGWVSPRLGIRFVMTTEDLEIYRPDGRKFLSSVEIEGNWLREQQLREQERQRAELAEQGQEEERQRADRVELERDQERQRAEQAESQLEQERQQLQNLKAQLQAMGIDPNTLN